MAPMHAKKGRRSGRKDPRSKRDSFRAARVEDELEVPDQDIETSEEENESERFDEVSSEDEEPLNKPKAYSLLLQSFGQKAEDGEPRRKRRKLDINSKSLSDGKSTLSNSRNIPENGGNHEDLSDGESAVEPMNEPEQEEQAEEDADDDEDSSDPFEVHFAHPDENDLAQQLEAVVEKKWHSRRIPFGSIGQCTLLSLAGSGTETSKPRSSPAVFSLTSLKLKKKLASAAEDLMPTLGEREKSLTTHLFHYRDTLFTGRTVTNSSKLRSLSCLHALNHIFKTRDRILKNSARLSKDDGNLDVEYRDQGFTRPKVLVLLPTRQSCVSYMDTITDLCQPEQQENKKRFDDNYFQPRDKYGDDRPDDFRELFEGNDDDMFRLGIKFTRKTIKYFSQFYNSDIIIASPLGLRRAIDSSEKTKKPDFDFLSSIEIVIMDQTDALLMQNWEHVTHIFQHLNHQPKEAHGCDFSRVRSWYLDGNARYLRQTIILSAYITPELNGLFSQYCHNITGKLKYAPEYEGAMLPIRELGIKQTFSRFTSPSLPSDPDARFKYFTTALLPSITKLPKAPDGSGLGVLIFIPSYFDFVRLRNYFATSSATQNISFGSISENQSPADRDIRRARSHFHAGRHSVLLYTGRAHHFFRYMIKGVKRVIMYGVPENPIFYQEIVGGLLGATVDEGTIGPAEANVRVMFSKWDALTLERVVGTKRIGTMLKEKGGDVFDFV